jgi:hypothetical protein
MNSIAVKFKDRKNLLLVANRLISCGRMYWSKLLVWGVAKTHRQHSDAAHSSVSPVTKRMGPFLAREIGSWCSHIPACKILWSCRTSTHPLLGRAAWISWEGKFALKVCNGGSPVEGLKRFWYIIRVHKTHAFMRYGLGRACNYSYVITALQVSTYSTCGWDRDQARVVTIGRYFTKHDFVELSEAPIMRCNIYRMHLRRLQMQLDPMITRFDSAIEKYGGWIRTEKSLSRMSSKRGLILALFGFYFRFALVLRWY